MKGLEHSKVRISENQQTIKKTPILKTAWPSTFLKILTNYLLIKGSCSPDRWTSVPLSQSTRTTTLKAIDQAPSCSFPPEFQWLTKSSALSKVPSSDPKFSTGKTNELIFPVKGLYSTHLWAKNCFIAFFFRNIEAIGGFFMAISKGCYFKRNLYLSIFFFFSSLYSRNSLNYF